MPTDTKNEDVGSTTSESSSTSSSVSSRLSFRRRWSKSRSSSRSTSDLSSSERSRIRRSFRSLPNYDFLQKNNEENEGSSLLPNAKWWHGVFIFSSISALACLISLWATYPIGARMPSDQIASMPWSNGCQGVATCICPRETVCADDPLSMILLTIARTTAWFDYPLYMLLFMSKANNLNNYMQKTALRCWVHFSDYHHVHSLFGIIVGLESTSHTLLHIARWARRNNDIHVRLPLQVFLSSIEF